MQVGTVFVDLGTILGQVGRLTVSGVRIFESPGRKYGRFGYGVATCVTCRHGVGRNPPFSTFPFPVDDDQIKQYEMCGAVTRFNTDRAAEIGVVEAATDEAADVQKAYDTLKAAASNPIVQTQNVTQAADKAEAQLRLTLPALLGPLASVATKATDVSLLAKSTLRVKQLERLTAGQLSDLADQLLTIGENQPAPLQKHYGLNVVLPLLRGYQQTLAPLVGQTQDLIDDRSGDNQSVDDLLKATLQQIYEQDKVMLVFKVINPDLYRDYRKARRIGTRGGGGKKKDKPQS